MSENLAIVDINTAPNRSTIMTNRRNVLSMLAVGAAMSCFDIASAQSAPVREINVALEGDDLNDGSYGKPLRTIEEAQRRVRLARAAGAVETIAISLADGIFPIRTTLVFDRRDADPRSPLLLRAQPGARPVISGGIELDGWRLANTLPEAPIASIGKVWVTKLPEGITGTNVLTDDEGLLRRAQTPAFTHTDKSDDWVGTDDQHTSVRVKERARLQRSLQPSPQAAQAKIIGAGPWTMNYLTIRSVSKDRINFVEKSTYALAAPRYYLGANSIHIENTFAGLTEPGSWVVDPQKKLIYLWPRNDRPRGVVIPTLTELVRIEGETHFDLPTDQPVSNIHISGIAFKHGRRYELSGQTGLGLQHDWESFDSATALIRFRAAEDCSVNQCTFQHSGGTGVRIDLHGRRISVQNNGFHHLGACAILLAGYGPGVKDVNGFNNITGNTINHIGQLWTHSSAIWAWQSGSNYIAYNKLEHLPYTGICITGRIVIDRNGHGECSRTVRWSEVGPIDASTDWASREKFLHARLNRVEYNDISSVLEQINDGNAIYISGAGKNNFIRNNYIHDCYTKLAGEAIRCDDDQNETIISRNIIARFGAYGTGICTKGRNHIIGNIIFNPSTIVLRGMISLEGYNSSDHFGSIIKDNILVGSGPNQPFMFKDVIVRLEPAEASKIIVEGNIYFNPVSSDESEKHFAWSRPLGLDRGSTSEDPKILDVTAAGPLFAPGSAARYGW